MVCKTCSAQLMMPNIMQLIVFCYSVRALIALPINEVFRDYSIYFYTLHYEWLLTRHRRTVAAFAELARRGPETGLQCIKL